MAKTWVLETQTKGTGATMVPLERVVRKRGADTVPGFVLPELKPPSSDPALRTPRIFKVIDVMTRQVLADEADARAAVNALEDVRSIVDVNVYVWEPMTEQWRMLRFGETRILWGYRSPDRAAA